MVDGRGETVAGGRFPRPRLLLSRCLELEACRYNAGVIRSGVVRLLEPHVELVAVCPEVEIGLGVPRPPIRLVAGDGTAAAADLRLVQPSTGAELTERMSGWANAFVDAAPALDGAILKSRSPSCGIRDAKVHAGPEETSAIGVTAGAFARVVLARFPWIAAEDEASLTDPGTLHHFLTRVWASANLRDAVAGGAAGLADFHRRYKLVLMAHSPGAQRALGRLVAEPGGSGGRSFDALARAYEAGFAGALAEPAPRGGHVNAIQHAQGYFKDQLSAEEKGRFGELVASYREGALPLHAVLGRVREWVERFDQAYLRDQAYFRPYPPGLST